MKDRSPIRDSAMCGRSSRLGRARTIDPHTSGQSERRARLASCSVRVITDSFELGRFTYRFQDSRVAAFNETLIQRTFDDRVDDAGAMQSQAIGEKIHPQVRIVVKNIGNDGREVLVEGRFSQPTTQPQCLRMRRKSILATCKGATNFDRLTSWVYLQKRHSMLQRLVIDKRTSGGKLLGCTVPSDTHVVDSVLKTQGTQTPRVAWPVPRPYGSGRC